jgi:glycosyltransferase involved in cell wall biosynthesis
MTTKLLLVAEAGAPTGFEKVMRNVGTYLHNTGKYDITVRGLGFESRRSTIRYPFEVKPWGGDAHDPVGVQQFGRWAEEDKPEAVWVVHDLWNILGFCLHKDPELPMTAYFPVDTPNMNMGNAWGIGAVSEAVSYTNFGANETAAGVRMAVDILTSKRPEVANQGQEWVQSTRIGKEFYGRMDRYARYQNPKGFNIVPHGLDTTMFTPRDKRMCRRLLKLPEKGFLITYVATNQFRKRLDLALRAFALLLQTVPDAWLVLHCAHDYGNGWDLAQLAYLYGIRDRVIFTHQTIGELTDDDLCTLYSAADVNINTSGGEGWGLPIFESAACGVSQIVPEWSATRELWKGHGLLTKVSDYRIEPKLGINTAHAIISTQHLAQQLVELAQNDEVRQEWAAKALAHAKSQPGWNVIGDAFDQIITNSRYEPEPRSYSLTDLQKLRTGTVESEISKWY